jgi:DNA-directed RNA polymerase subunit K/omega
MYDELKDERIVEKAGGWFKLCALIQKRMVALNRNAPPLVDLKTNDKMQIALREILEGKIYLDTSGAVRERISDHLHEGMYGDVSDSLGGE